MGALLASFGLKDGVYLALILGGLGAFGWYTYHERAVQHTKDVQADARAVAAEAKADSALKTATALANSVAQGDYSHEITIPVVSAPVPDRLCKLALGSGKTVVVAASAGSGNAEAAGGTTDASTASELQQFADAAVKIARDDDAQITALQTIIANIRHELGEANVN